MTIDVKKPDKPYDHKFHGAGGHQIQVHSDDRFTGAWLMLGGSGAGEKSLHLVSMSQGSGPMNYVGYRDGKSNANKLAVAVEPDGGVTIQVVLSGEGNELARVRMLSLEQLETLVADNGSNHYPA